MGTGERIIRVLIADDEALLAMKLVQFLNERGFVARHVRTSVDVRVQMQTWEPDFILYDLMLKETNAITFLRQMQMEGRLGGKTKLFVLSGHKNQLNIKECMRLGATDFVAKPVTHADLLSRLALHMQPKREVQEAGSATVIEDFESAQYYMHLTDLTMREALKGAPATDCLHNLCGLIGHSLKAVRVSTIKCDFEQRRGLVAASNDKRNIGLLELDLGKYPEIVYVLMNEKILALDNLTADPAMATVARQQKSISFNGMIVAPIRIGGNLWGVLSVRLPDSKKRLSEFEIRYVQLVSHVMALVIRGEPGLLLPGFGSGGTQQSA